MKVRFHEAAEGDLAAAAAYYDDAAEGLGARILAEVRSAVDLVENYPEAAPLLSRNIRGKRLSRFPHTLLYAIEKDEVVVLAFAHQRQDFRTWIEVIRTRRTGA